MIRTPFATLVFKGKRFAAATMPVDVLAELPAYRELVMAVARGLFIQKNPGRKKLPRGFESGFQLVLEGIQSGSAIPVLSREAPSLMPVIVGGDYFEQARDFVERAIRAEAGGGPFPDDIPKEALGCFNAFGRSLQPEEAIVVAPPGSRDGALYNRDVRRKLILRTQNTVEEPVTLVGTVRAANRDADGFSLRTLDGQKFEARAATPFIDIAIKSLDEEALVVVRGNGLYSQSGKLQKVLTVSDVSLAEEGEEGFRPGCTEPVEDQVTSLAELKSDWFDTDSPTFPAPELAWVSKLLKTLVEAFDLPTPYVYPTPEGAVRAEWTVSPWELSLEVNASRKHAEVIAVRLDSDEVHENAFGLDEVGAELKMGRYISQHVHGRLAV